MTIICKWKEDMRKNKDKDCLKNSSMTRIIWSEKDREYFLHAESELMFLLDFKVTYLLILVSPKKDKPNNLNPMTPSINKKDSNSILPPSSHKNLPPRPVQHINPNNNVSYKLPPKPTPLIPSKQNNSIDYSRPHSSR